MWFKMKASMISLLLLLAGLNFSDGQTLPKIQNIPDAPALPRFNLPILPEHIKALFAKSSENKPVAKISNWDEQLDYKIKGLKDLENHGEYDDDDGNMKNGDRMRAKTYGMSIGGDRGAVWNDFTQISHHVGKFETASIVAKPEENNKTLISYENVNFEDDKTEDNFGEGSKEEIVEESVEERDDQSVENADYSKENLGEREDENPDLNFEEENIFDNLTDHLEAGVKNLARMGNHPPIHSNNKKRDAKTYGMSLAGDSGTVWNDLHSSRVSYHVGEPEKVTNAPKPEHITQTGTSSNEKIEISLEADNVDENSDEIEYEVVDEIKDNNKNSEEGDLDSKEFKESSVEEENLDDNSGEIKDEVIDGNNDNFGEIDIDSKEMKVENSDDNPGEMKDEVVDEIKDNNDNPGLDSKEIEESFDEVKRIFEKLIQDNKDKSEIPGNQIIKKDSKEDNKTTDKKIQLSNENKNSSETSIHKNDHNKVEPTKDLCQKNKLNEGQDQDNQDFNKDKDKSKETVEHKDKESNVKAMVNKLMNEIRRIIRNEVENQIKAYIKDHRGIINKEDKIDKAKNTTTDEPAKTSKLNATENGETDDKLRSKNHQNKSDKPLKIEAQNVYGSSVGNGKVTNIFIFNINNSSDLQHIKPISNGTDEGVFVFGVDKKPDKEKNNDKTPVQHKEETKPDENMTNDINNKTQSEMNNNKTEVGNENPKEKPEKENSTSKEDKNDTGSNNEQTAQPSDYIKYETTEKPDGEVETNTEVKEKTADINANKPDGTKEDSSSETARTESEQETLSATESDAVQEKSEDEKADTNSSDKNAESIDIDKRSDMNDKTESINKNTEDKTVDGTDKTEEKSEQAN